MCASRGETVLTDFTRGLLMQDGMWKDWNVQYYSIVQAGTSHGNLKQQSLRQSLPGHQTSALAERKTRLPSPNVKNKHTSTLERLPFKLYPQRRTTTPPYRAPCLLAAHPARLLTRVPLDADNLARALALEIHDHEQLGDLEPRPCAVEVHLQLAVHVGPFREDEPLVCHALWEEAGVEGVDLQRRQEEVPCVDARVVREGRCGVRVA